MDLDTLRFLAAPFAASLILTGIHAYLGVHVVERGVIFVDLSLAQIAALGATIAMLLPFGDGDPHGPWTYWISLAFTFIGAAVFSTIRVKRARIPQEAIIGISYAVASAASILAMSKPPRRASTEDSWWGTSGRLLVRGLHRPPLRPSGVFTTLPDPVLAISMSHGSAEAEGVRCGNSFSTPHRIRVPVRGPRRGALGFCYLIVPRWGCSTPTDQGALASAGPWARWCPRGIPLFELDMPTGATMSAPRSGPHSRWAVDPALRNRTGEPPLSSLRGGHEVRHVVAMQAEVRTASRCVSYEAAGAADS